MARPKRGLRRPRRTLRRAKREPQRPREPPTPPTALLHRLGALDHTLRDTSSVETYAWTRTAPAPCTPAPAATSLRSRAAAVVAQEVARLGHAPIDWAPQWRVWQPVWERLTTTNQDTPELFRQFAGFSHEPGFACHHRDPPPSIGYTSALRTHAARQTVLENTTVPGRPGALHRVERLWPHVLLRDVSAYVLAMPRPVHLAIDLRGCTVPRDDLLRLVATPGLVAVDVSHQPAVDDAVLAAMATGSLRVVCANHTSVTAAGCERWMARVGTNTKGCYLETSVRASAPAGWVDTCDPVVRRQSLGRRLHYTNHHHAHEKLELASHVLLEVVVAPLEPPHDPELLWLWSPSTDRVAHGTYVHRAAAPSKPVPARRPARRTTFAASFFGLS